MSTSSPVVPFSSYNPRVAIVTGASQGIGRSIALRLASDGIDIGINDIAAKQEQIDAIVKEVQKTGRRAIALPGDVTSEPDVAAMVEKTALELGGVDIMVANAGVVKGIPIVETPIEIFDFVCAVNIRGVFLCFKHAAIQMIKQGRGGRIIGASSIAGKQGLAGAASYSASKFAVRGLTQSASKEMQKHGITVNSYAPGYTRTPMLEGSIKAQDITDRGKSQPQTIGDVPVGEPESMASIVSYLAKPESYFLNGQTIIVDGGFRFD